MVLLAPCCREPSTLPNTELVVAAPVRLLVAEPVRLLVAPVSALVAGLPCVCQFCISVGQLGAPAARFSPKTWGVPSPLSSMTDIWLVCEFHTIPACLATSGTGA